MEAIDAIKARMDELKGEFAKYQASEAQLEELLSKYSGELEAIRQHLIAINAAAKELAALYENISGKPFEYEAAKSG